MPPSVAHDLLILLFILQLTELSVSWNHQCRPFRFRAYRASTTVPRQLRPRTPDDSPACRAAARTRSQSIVAAPAVPYAQLKGRRRPLREKLIATAGYACPNVACRYFIITDSTIHTAEVDFGRLLKGAVGPMEPATVAAVLDLDVHQVGCEANLLRISIFKSEIEQAEPVRHFLAHHASLTPKDNGSIHLFGHGIWSVAPVLRAIQSSG